MAYIHSKVYEEIKILIQDRSERYLKIGDFRLLSVHVDFLHFEGVIAACVFFWEKGRCLLVRTLPRM